jgi:XTP/dITP diphosphohydrolase
LRRIYLATKNQGKINEVKAELRDLDIDVLTPDPDGSFPEVIEDGSTFLENALKKAKALADATGGETLADDSGLEVDALGGKPGIFSSRYSGPGATDETNILRLLDDLKGVPEERRSARFRCVIVLYRPGADPEVFEGILEGRIASEPAGCYGFGYDPVFFVPEYNRTVAQMTAEMKNRISHRGQALRLLKKSLQMRGSREKNRSAGRSAAW